jgi:hypothetical protein
MSGGCNVQQQSDPSTPLGSQRTKRAISPEQAELFCNRAKSKCTRDEIPENSVDFDIDFENFTSERAGLTPKKMSQGTGPESSKDMDLIRTWHLTLANHRMETKADMMSIISEITNGMLARIVDLEAEVCKKEWELDVMRYQMDSVDQSNRVRNAKVVGVVEAEEENPKEKILEIAKKIKANISSSDIVRCERIGKIDPDGNKPRTIMTRFATTSAKMEFFKMRKALGTSKDAELKKVFVNEDLAPLRSKFLYVARMLKSDGLIHKYWVYKNEVQVKFLESDEKGTPVRNLEIFSDFHTHQVFKDILKPRFVPKQSPNAETVFKSKPAYAEVLAKYSDVLHQQSEGHN